MYHWKRSKQFLSFNLYYNLSVASYQGQNTGLGLIIDAFCGWRHLVILPPYHSAATSDPPSYAIFIPRPLFWRCCIILSLHPILMSLFIALCAIHSQCRISNGITFLLNRFYSNRKEKINKIHSTILTKQYIFKSWLFSFKFLNGILMNPHDVVPFLFIFNAANKSTFNFFKW